MGKLKERLLAVLSERSHTKGKWRGRYSQRRPGMGLFGLVAEKSTGASKSNASVNDQPVSTYLKSCTK